MPLAYAQKRALPWRLLYNGHYAGLWYRKFGFDSR